MRTKKILAGAFMVLMVLTSCSTGSTTATSTTKAENMLIYADMEQDGTAHIVLPDGSCIEINDEVKTAVLTKDRSKIVVLLEDGTLYFTDKDQEAKTIVADDCDSINSIRNDGFFYYDEENTVYRVLFADGSVVKLGEDVTFAPANDNTSVLYCTSDSVYTLANTSEEANKVAKYTEGTIKVGAISNDAQTSVWAVSDGTTGKADTLFMNVGDEKQTLGEVTYTGKYSYSPRIYFSSDQQVIAVIHSKSDKMWVKNGDEEIIEVNLGGEVSSLPQTKEGYLYDSTAAQCVPLYIESEGETGNNLYRISLDGDRERLLSGIDAFEISNGNVFYIDEDENLRYASLNENDLDDAEKIASDVESFSVSSNGQYIYYMRDVSDYIGTLYCYKVGEDDSVRVAGDVYEWNFYNSTSGSSVYFFKDTELIDDTYTTCGTLMKWTYGADEAEKISSEVIVYSLTSGLDTYELNADGFTFVKYTSNDDDNVYGNIMHYNGAEATKIASDVIYY